MALVALSPLLVVLAVLIKMGSPGPVLYRGQRVGRNMRPFTIYKFRTLLPDAEARIGARLLTDRDKAELATPIGRLLKRTKLDELPQLLNVIKGDMRFVGPRPVRPVFLDQLCRDLPAFHRRLCIPPGLTGIAQLRGGYYTSPRNKLRYDLIYLRRRSPLLDGWVVLLTLVKILDRWLSSGIVVVFLFVFASFVPTELQPVVHVPLLGLDVSLITALVVVFTLCVLLRNRRSRFSLYRSPLNLPILCFVLLNAASALLTEHHWNALRGSTYHLVTGYLTAFVILNTLVTPVFVRWTVRVIALSSVVISLLGLFEVFLANHNTASALGPEPSSSILEDPVILAVYLVLGIPLLLSEITMAATSRARDLWLIATTISFVGVFLTQTRIGLAALLVTAMMFLLRRRGQVLEVVGVLVLCVLLVASLGAGRLSPTAMANAAGAWIDNQTTVLSAHGVARWLVGGGASVTAAVAGPTADLAVPPVVSRSPGNMHVTLILEHGVLGWLVTIWLILSTVAAVMSAHRRAKDERVQTVLWAIASSLVGYLVSMASTNTFYHLPIQVFFWSLIGIGLGMVTQVDGQRRSNLIWRFGAAGD